MKGHPNRKDLIRAANPIADLKDKRRQDVLSHIEKCNGCSQKYKAIKSLLEPSDNKSIKASNQLEERISSSYRQIMSEEKPSQVYFSFFFQRYARIFAYSAMAIIITFLTLFYINRTENGYKPFPLVFKNIKGRTLIDNELHSLKSIEQNSFINQDNNSFSELSLTELLSIKMTGKTRLIVEKSLFNKRLNIYKLDFNLTAGDIHAKFQHDKGLDYSFKTPHAMIKSMGTEFVLHVNKKRTRLVLIDGKLGVKSLTSKRQITATKGKVYTIDTRIKINETDKNVKDLEKSVPDPRPKKDNLSNIRKTEKNEDKDLSSDKKINKNFSYDRKDDLKDVRKEIRNEKKQLMKEKRESRKEIKKLHKIRKGF